MILFLVGERHIYSMAPGDSLSFSKVVESQVRDNWLSLDLMRLDGSRSFLIELKPAELGEFQLRLIACLEAGRNDHTLLVDLEGLRTLVKGEYHG